MTSIISIYRRFPTKESCLEHLEAVRWKDEPCCPYCKSEKVSKKTEKEQRNRWQCSLCRKSFSVTVGTIFHNSHVDLQRWFLLIAIMFSAKKGLSAMQAARDLEMRRPTVWSMMHRIRAAMVDDGKLLAGIVEMDETYIGGKPRKSNYKDPDDKGSPRGRGTAKAPVVGAVERGGRVKVRAALKMADASRCKQRIGIPKHTLDALDACAELLRELEGKAIVPIEPDKLPKGFTQLDYDELIAPYVPEEKK